MKIYKIPFHSFIDVITNSSTEVYIKAHDKARETVIEVMDKILKQTGSDKKTEDIYDVKVVGAEVDEDDIDEENTDYEKIGDCYYRHELGDEESYGDDCIFLIPKDGSEPIDLISVMPFSAQEIMC